MECFDCLPLACLVNESFLCMHGGLSPHISLLNQINQLQRTKEPEQSGAVCDFLWSDPFPDQYKDLQSVWMNNQAWGCSYYFGWAKKKNSGKHISLEKQFANNNQSPRSRVRGIQILSLVRQSKPGTSFSLSNYNFLCTKLLRHLCEQSQYIKNHRR